jgi:hypothetical protein
MKQVDIRWQSFRENKFKHDCVNIELTKNDCSTVTYHGPGEVWQDEGGVISFKCFCRDEHGTAVKSFLNNAALEAGKIIPDEAYYSMRMTTFDNTKWSAEDVWLHLNANLVTRDAIIT